MNKGLRRGERVKKATKLEGGKQCRKEKKMKKRDGGFDGQKKNAVMSGTDREKGEEIAVNCNVALSPVCVYVSVTNEYLMREAPRLNDTRNSASQVHFFAVTRDNIIDERPRQLLCGRSLSLSQHVNLKSRRKRGKKPARIE